MGRWVQILPPIMAYLVWEKPAFPKDAQETMGSQMPLLQILNHKPIPTKSTKAKATAAHPQKQNTLPAAWCISLDLGTSQGSHDLEAFGQDLSPCPINKRKEAYMSGAELSCEASVTSQTKKEHDAHVGMSENRIWNSQNDEFPTRSISLYQAPS